MVTGELFLAGAVGAISPEIVRLYEMRSDRQLRFSKFYVLISIAYVALGGYVATIFPGIEEPFWACCIGAGLVLVVNKMVYIGGRMTESIARIAGGSPEKTQSKSGQFGRHSAEEERPLRASFLDFTRKL